MSQYEMTVGPEGYLATPVSSRGVVLPSKGEGLVLGKVVPEQQAIDEAARRLLNAKNPTIFPGPLVLWAWNEQATARGEGHQGIGQGDPGQAHSDAAITGRSTRRSSRRRRSTRTIRI